MDSGRPSKPTAPLRSAVKSGYAPRQKTEEKRDWCWLRAGQARDHLRVLNPRRCPGLSYFSPLGRWEIWASGSFDDLIIEWDDSCRWRQVGGPRRVAPYREGMNLDSAFHTLALKSSDGHRPPLQDCATCSDGAAFFKSSHNRIANHGRLVKTSPCRASGCFINDL